jgi:hypothetical protein
MNELCIFTCEYSSPPLDSSLLRTSCERVGVELHAFGRGERWPGYGLAKIRSARQYLATRPEEYALFLDASDTFILSRAVDILESFRGLHVDMLVSGEKNSFPVAGDAARYPQWGDRDDPGTPWRFINSGSWIGLRTILIDALGEMDNILVSLARQGGIRSNSDGCCWIEWMLCHHRHDMYSYVDARCQLFQTMWGTNEMLGNGMNSLTGTWPMVWHFNGCRSGMCEWYERLIHEDRNKKEVEQRAISP